MTRHEEESVTQFHIRAIQAEAWQQGYIRGALDAEVDMEPADNPYIRAGESIFE